MIKPWKILASTITYEDRWLKVRSDRCETADGLLIEPYHVIEYPDWVCVVALKSDGKILLNREYRHGCGRILVGLPSGAMDTEDASPEQAIRRELLEETGFTSRHMLRVGTTFASPSNLSNRVHCFLGLGLERCQEPSLDTNEAIEPVEQDFIAFMQATLEGKGELHGLQVAALHFAMAYILQSNSPHLQLARDQVRSWLGRLLQPT